VGNGRSIVCWRRNPAVPGCLSSGCKRKTGSRALIQAFHFLLIRERKGDRKLETACTGWVTIPKISILPETQALINILILSIAGFDA